MSAPVAPTNAPASTGFLSSLFGAKKTNAPKPANAAAPAPAVGGRRRSRRHRGGRSRSRKDRSRKDRKNRNRSRKNRNRE